MEPKVNNWLIQEFGISLYMDHGWVACSGNDLVNEPAAESPYEKVFCNLNQKVERRKLRRYDAGQLLTLNREKLDTQGRECKVCGRMDRLVDLAGQNEPPDLRCPWCKRFLEMSKQLVERDVYVVYRALEEKEKTNLPAIDEKTVKLPLPAADGRVYLCLEPEETACAHLEGERAVVRIYSKKFLPKLPGSIRLDMGDYVYRKHAAQKDLPTMEELAACSSGIQRIGRLPDGCGQPGRGVSLWFPAGGGNGPGEAAAVCESAPLGSPLPADDPVFPALYQWNFEPSL